MILALLAGGWLTAARAGANEPTEGMAGGGAPNAGTTPETVYASYSNEALTALAAQWDTLDVHQRRALLTEVRQRMARNGSGQGSGLINIRTERRYGRIIRRPDGRVIRIETKVVQVRPIPESALAGRGFGVGFERRTGTLQPEHPAMAASDGSASPPIEPASAPVQSQGGTLLKPSTAPALQPIP